MSAAPTGPGPPGQGAATAPLSLPSPPAVPAAAAAPPSPPPVDIGKGAAPQPAVGRSSGAGAAAAAGAAPGGGGGDGDDDDDPVVAEFEVWHSRTLYDCLNLFQFPLRPAGCGYNMQKLKRCQRQVHSQRFRLEFDPRPPAPAAAGGGGVDFGEAPASIVEDEAAKKDTTRTQPFVMASTRVKNKTNYAVGVVRGDRLTLTALANVHQFRPDLDANRALNPDNDRLAPAPGGDDAAHASTSPRFRADHTRQETLRQYQSKLRSSWAELLEREPWLTLSFTTHDELRSKHLVFSKLFCSDNTTLPFDPATSMSRYLNHVFRIAVEPWMRERYWKIPLAIANRKPLNEQVESLMGSAHVMRFARLKELIRTKEPASDVDVFAHLDTCAVLVRGLWIVKSLPEVRGAQALVREWVLYKLWEKHGVVRRAQLTEPPFALSVDTASVRKLLEDVAELDPVRRVWKLKHGGCDQEFINVHHSHVTKQDAAWQKRAEQIIANVQDPPPPAATGKPTMGHQSAPRGVASQRRADPRELQRKVAEWIGRCFTDRNRGVWGRAELAQHFRRAQVAYRGVVPDELYHSLLKQMTIEFRDGALVLTKLGTAETQLDIDRYRYAYISCFRKQRSWEAQEIERSVATLVAQEHLPVPQHLHQKVMDELSTPSGRGPTAVWTAKTGSEPYKPQG